MAEVCQEIQEYVRKLRRRLHQVPETGLQLPRTAAFLQEELKALGIPFRACRNSSGIVAEIQGGSGKTVALRADMDGLPVQEETGLPWSSERPGCMHACGHDAHAAMLLGAARLLKEKQDTLQGTVRLLFQPGEETMNGAKSMIREGCMEGVDTVFGTHIGTLLGDWIPSGTLVAMPGGCLASTDCFRITIRGKGTHGSMPEKGVDPIRTAASVLLGLDGILSREVPASQAVVLTVGRIAAGETSNVIPETAVMEGSLRTLDAAVRSFVLARMEEVVNGLAAAARAEGTLEILESAPPVVNDAEMAALAARAAEKWLPPEQVWSRPVTPSMVSEDFAWYLQEAPGAFLLLSAPHPDPQKRAGHHNNRFDIDEEVLWEGAVVLAQAAEDFLAG